MPAPEPLPEPAPERSVRRRQLTVDRCLAAASALASLVIGLVNLGRFPSYAQDEGVYTMQAWAVLHGQLTPYPYWYDHPFLGWVQISPFLALGRCLAPGTSPVADARLAAVTALAVDAGLMFLIARRLRMGRCAAILAVALFVFSPLVQDEMRRVFLDNVAMPWVLAAVALALSARSWESGPIRAGMCFAVAVLSKETSLVIAPAVLVAIARNADPGERRPALRAACVSFLAVASLYPLYALLRGHLFPTPGRASLIKTMKWQLLDRAGSGSVFDPASARHHSLLLWLHHDRFLIVAGAIAAVLLLASRRLQPIALAVLLPVAFVVRPSGYSPAMFVIIALPFLALCIAAAAELLIMQATSAAYSVMNLGAARAATTAGWLSLTLLAATLPAQQRLHASDVFVARLNGLPAQAVTWIGQNLPPSQRLLVDDIIWIDLAAAGRGDPWRQTVFFYRLDTVALGRTRLRDGWRDINYVISTPTVRHGVDAMPSLVQCREALRHSTLVRTFGGGIDRIEVRRVTP
jgi:hypothetical protein